MADPDERRPTELGDRTDLDVLSRHRRRTALAAAIALRATIPLDHLSARFQPIVDLHSGDPIGVEALLRWRHGDRLLDADRFVELAEHRNAVPEIGDRMRDQVWGLASDARNRTGRGDHLWFVGVSWVELTTPGFVGSVSDLLDRHEPPASVFVLELPAVAGLLADADAHRAVQELGELGVGLALHHVGPGSSLDLLPDLPIDVVKVPADLADDSEYGIGAVVEAARPLGIAVVAEGVDTAAQLEVAAASGARFGQGDFLAPAGPLAEVLTLLEISRDVDLGCDPLRR